MLVGGDVRACSDRKAVLRRWASRVAFSFGLVAGAVTSPASVLAKDYPGDVAGKSRAHFDFETLYWVGAIGLPKDGNQLQIRNDAVGVFGHPRFPLGFGLGYGLSENMVIGARLDFSADMRDDLGPGGVTLRAGISPYLEFLFLRDNHVRPFAQLRAGVGGGRTFVRVPGQRALESTGASIVYPLIGLALGTHVFFSEEVSFDAMLGLEHRWNVRRQRGTEITVLEDVEVTRWQLLDTSVSIAFTLGFSRWF
jgi:hypothetical protein